MLPKGIEPRPVRATSAHQRGRGVVVGRHGRLLGVAGFTVWHGKMLEIDLLMEPGRLRELELSYLDE